MAFENCYQSTAILSDNHTNDANPKLIDIYCCFLLTGYVYVSLMKEFDSFENPSYAYYRPDIGPAIWNGFIDIDPVTPSGHMWDEFAEKVIEEYQDPVWEPYLRLPPNAPISSVSTYAGVV